MTQRSPNFCGHCREVKSRADLAGVALVYLLDAMQDHEYEAMAERTPECQ